MILRSATAADRPQILALFAEHLEALGYDPDPDLDRDMRQLPGSYAHAPNAFMVAVLEDGSIAAMGGLLDGEIRRLYVRSDVRRRGLARMIVERLVSGRESGFAIVDRQNQPAHASF